MNLLEIGLLCLLALGLLAVGYLYPFRHYLRYRREARLINKLSEMAGVRYSTLRPGRIVRASLCERHKWSFFKYPLENHSQLSSQDWIASIEALHNDGTLGRYHFLHSKNWRQRDTPEWLREDCALIADKSEREVMGHWGICTVLAEKGEDIVDVTLQFCGAYSSVDHCRFLHITEFVEKICARIKTTNPGIRDVHLLSVVGSTWDFFYEFSQRMPDLDWINERAMRIDPTLPPPKRPRPRRKAKESDPAEKPVGGFPK